MRNISKNDERALLSEIVNNQPWHARFLNTLALMELCGAHRVARVISFLPKRTFLLEHAAEEYRHAYFLRRLANKLSDVPLEDFGQENVFCLRQSKSYIRNLDRRICLLLRSHGLLKTHSIHRLAYLLTTFAIEQRALPFYNLYQEVIDEHAAPISIRSVISEEEDHLREMDEQISRENLPSKLIDDCFMMERSLFAAWLTQVAKELN